MSQIRTERSVEQRTEEARSRVLVAEDEVPVRTLLTRVLERAGHEVVTVPNGEAAWEAVRHGVFDMVVLDLDLPLLGGLEVLQHIRRFDPDLPVIILSGYGSVSAAVRCIQLGAHDYLEKPSDPVRLLHVVEQALLLRTSTMRARAANREHPGIHGLIGDSPPIRLLCEQIRRIARYDVPVLVLGESGTGKELVARAVHAESLRARGAFVAFNAAAVTDTLFESTLFGHARGAFTGAVAAHKGLMEEADGGTLVLDEIGDMTLGNQVKLLRALETGEVRPVGGATSRHVDVRLVACTNADLGERVQMGTFRADLFYRLRGVALHVPPLRARPADVPLLAMEFLRRANHRYRLALRGFDQEAMEALLGYAWPGNVRELLHTVGSAALLATGAWVSVADLPPGILASRKEAERRPVEELPDEDLTLDTAEKRHVRRVLALTEGNRSAAAQRLGVSRQSLYRLMSKHGVE
jgi:DNA-binding NtrC family response regulator